MYPAPFLGYAAIEDADFFSPEVCHLVAGDTQSAIESLELQLKHGHIGLWREWHELPVYDLIRNEPRYVDLMAEYDLKIAEQRELIAKLDEGVSQ
jgi:hypothetical protein